MIERKLDHAAGQEQEGDFSRADQVNPAVGRGAVNEIVARDQIVERAWELARLIMKTNRSTRRLTHHVAVRPWRALVEQNLRQHVYAEMYSFNLVKSSHDFEQIEYSDDKIAKM